MVSNTPSKEMSIDQFLIEKPCPNGHLNFKDLFQKLYIKFGPLRIKGKKYPWVIRLAHLEAKQTGKGSFKRLINHLMENFPDFPIIVENVLTARFACGIVGMGGEQITFDESPDFVFNLRLSEENHHDDDSDGNRPTSEWTEPSTNRI
jgi:hypothetical protein